MFLCFSKTSLFYNPGRITAVHNDSGLQGTWSWNSSNFHSDDVMDSSYNDPSYVPVYSLDGIDAVIVAVWTFFEITLDGYRTTYKLTCLGQLQCNSFFIIIYNCV